MKLDRPIRIVVSLAGLALLTLAARAFPVNATTVGFAYLLLVLIVASTWGFIEASILSIAATLTFNFFFLPPVGTFNIAETQNWVALVHISYNLSDCQPLIDKGEAACFGRHRASAGY